MYAGLVIHDVADFDTWKAPFDAHEPARRDAGLAMHDLHQGADDPNEVVGFVAAPAIGTLQAFLADPGASDVMDRAGVAGPPSVTFVGHVEMKGSA